MPTTYEPIATQTLGTASATVTFNSIPQTYTEIVLVGSYTATATLDTRLTFNSDTGTNYSATRLMGDGTSATSNRSSNRAFIDLNYVGGVGTTAPTVSTLHIMNYSNTTTYKSTLLRANEMSGTYQGTELIAGIWRSTSAITTITITTSTSTYAAGSSFILYGVKAA